MATEDTLFKLPIDPEEFSVPLPPAALQRIDFSALEFATARKALIENLRVYYPNDFNDFVKNNGVIMFVELLAYITSVLSLRSDIVANDSTLATAFSTDAVINHLATIGQRIMAATPATTNIECSLDTPLIADIRIPAGLTFEIRGDDGKPITYELYSAPGDFSSALVIPAGKKGVIGFGIEGRTKQAAFVSDGSPSQQLTINDKSVIEDPIIINVTVGDTTEEWTRIDFIEKAAPTDKSYEVRFFNDRVVVVFGDNSHGLIPSSNTAIRVTYRTGGGVRGRIGVGIIDTQKAISPQSPYTAQVGVRFRNLTASEAGTDRESIENAKKRAPRDFATHLSATTDDDYAQLAQSFSHPVFGTVAKAVATLRTSLNANRVELYVLALGEDGEPVTPSAGLKKALSTFIDDINVLTDGVFVLDGALKPVDVQMTIAMNKNSDASVIKTKVDKAVEDFFALANFDMGESLYVAQLYKTINQIDGIVNIDIFKPADNILPTSRLSDPSVGGVGVNELIVLGDKEISYYYAR